MSKFVSRKLLHAIQSAPKRSCKAVMRKKPWVFRCCRFWFSESLCTPMRQGFLNACLLQSNDPPTSFLFRSYLEGFLVLGGRFNRYWGPRAELDNTCMQALPRNIPLIRRFHRLHPCNHRLSQCPPRQLQLLFHNRFETALDKLW